MKTSHAVEALDRKLEAYAKSGVYPFHMPGHKRTPFPMPNPYTIDITEMDGFDDLHQAGGILKEAQARAAALYGAKQSYYLVNGSTCGILTAIFAAAPRKGTLLMARNVHKSVYHAAYLRNLSLVYANPHSTQFGISGAVQPEEIAEKLAQNPGVDAVVITSPTYEGVVSDIAAIAAVVHRYQIPLVVDEAHGAHFGFHAAFPQTAVRCGADIVVQSMHKALPSLTQTALLHLNSAYILPEAIEKYRSMFETSSPSYVLMAAMEKCVRLLSKEGEGLFFAYAKRLGDFYRDARSLKKLHVMERADFTTDEIYGLDPSKLILSVKGTSIDGRSLFDSLAGRYQLQLELASGFYALAMTSIMDRREGFERLYAALCELDGEISKRSAYPDGGLFVSSLYQPKKKGVEFYEAMDLAAEEVSFEAAVGRLAGSIVSLYPPGVPVLLPGEVIEGEFLENISKCRNLGLNVQGIADINNERINVVKR